HALPHRAAPAARACHGARARRRPAGSDRPVSAPQAVFVGVATEDAIAVVDRYPGSDERVVSSAMTFGGGGPAATAAVAAARLGIRAAVVAAVGDDEAGARVRERLADEGVDVSGVVTVPGAATSRSM